MLEDQLSITLDPRDAFALLNILEQAALTRQMEEADPEHRWVALEERLTERLREQVRPWVDMRAQDIYGAFVESMAKLGVIPHEDDALEIGILARRLGVLERVKVD